MIGFIILVAIIGLVVKILNQKNKLNKPCIMSPIDILKKNIQKAKYAIQNLKKKREIRIESINQNKQKRIC
jgi:hypothetical protein